MPRTEVYPDTLGNGYVAVAGANFSVATAIAGTVPSTAVGVMIKNDTGSDLWVGLNGTASDSSSYFILNGESEFFDGAKAYIDNIDILPEASGRVGVKIKEEK